MIKIVAFKDKYLDHAASLFSRVYSDEEGVYDPKMARKRIEDDLKTGLDYSFVALVNNLPAGEIITKVVWADKGWNLWVDTLQVEPGYQKQGLARRLLKTAIDKARAAGAVGVDMQVDIKKPFPGNWYEKIGFEKTDWVAYYAKINSVKF